MAEVPTYDVKLKTTAITDVKKFENKLYDKTNTTTELTPISTYQHRQNEKGRERRVGGRWGKFSDSVIPSTALGHIRKSERQTDIQKHRQKQRDREGGGAGGEGHQS